MDPLTRTAVHTPAGGGTPNDAFGLNRRFHVQGDAHTLSVFEEDIPKDAGPPRHIHRTADELFVVLRGRVLFEADSIPLEAGEGDTVLIPRGKEHAFKGLAPEGSTVLITLSPGGGDGFFRAVSDAGLNPPADMDRIAEIAVDYDLTFTGPPL